jgi:hypothetical protein
MRILRPLFLSALFFSVVFIQMSCSAPSNPAWDEFFTLVQNGKVYDGKVIGYRAPHDAYPYPYTTPDLVEVQIEYRDGEGQLQSFWELWPIQEKRSFPEEHIIPVYEWLPNKVIPRASKTLLQVQKVM